MISNRKHSYLAKCREIILYKHQWYQKHPISNRSEALTWRGIIARHPCFAGVVCGWKSGRCDRAQANKNARRGKHDGYPSERSECPDIDGARWTGWETHRCQVETAVVGAVPLSKQHGSPRSGGGGVGVEVVRRTSGGRGEGVKSGRGRGRKKARNGEGR